MFGRWPFCKTEGSRISSLRVYLLVIVISLCFCLGREGRIAYIILDMLRLNWIIHVKVCIYLPPPHYYLFPPLLLPLSSSAFTLFPPFSLIIKQAHRYLFWTYVRHRHRQSRSFPTLHPGRGRECTHRRQSTRRY